MRDATFVHKTIAQRRNRLAHEAQEQASAMVEYECAMKQALEEDVRLQSDYLPQSLPE